MQTLHWKAPAGIQTRNPLIQRKTRRIYTEGPITKWATEARCDKATLKLTEVNNRSESIQMKQEIRKLRNQKSECNQITKSYRSWQQCSIRCFTLKLSSFVAPVWSFLKHVAAFKFKMTSSFSNTTKMSNFQHLFWSLCTSFSKILALNNLHCLCIIFCLLLTRFSNLLDIRSTVVWINGKTIVYREVDLLYVLSTKVKSLF